MAPGQGGQPGQPGAGGADGVTGPVAAGGPGSGGPVSGPSPDENGGSLPNTLVSTGSFSYGLDVSPEIDPISFDPAEIHQTGDSGYVMVGTATRTSGDTDLWVARLAQGGSVFWSKLYGQSSDIAGLTQKLDVCQASDGGIGVVGETGDYRPAVVKIGPDGLVQWRTVIGTSLDFPESIRAVDGGGFVVAGTTNEFVAGVGDPQRNPWAARLSSAGEVLWEQGYITPGEGTGRDIEATQDGGFVLVGHDRTGDEFLFERTIIRGFAFKINSSGSKLAEYFNGNPTFTGRVYFGSVTEDEDGNIYIAGREGAGAPSPIIVKLTADLSEELWEESDSRADQSSFADVAAAPGGGALAGGYYQEFHEVEPYFRNFARVVRYDADGDVMWELTLPPSQYYSNGVQSVAAAPDGRWIVAVDLTDTAVYAVSPAGTVDESASFGLPGNYANPIKVIPVDTDADGSPDDGFVTLGSAPAFLIRVDTAGNFEWEADPPGESRERGNSIVEMSDGGFIVVGQRLTSEIGGGHAWILRLDISGNVIWQRIIDREGDDAALAIRRAADGNVIILDASASIIKMSDSGSVLWEKTYPSDRFEDLETLADGGFVAAATAGLARFDEGGETLWSYSYDPLEFNGLGIRFDLAADGGYFITPHTLIAPAVLKLDSEGTPVWTVELRGPQGERLQGLYTASIQGTADGGCIVAADTRHEGGGSRCEGEGVCPNLWLIKLDAQGEVDWQRTYATASTDFARDITRTFLGGYVVAAQSDGFAFPYYDAWVVAVGVTGEIAPSCPDGIGEDASGVVVELDNAATDESWTTSDRASVIMTPTTAVPATSLELQLSRSCSGLANSDFGQRPADDTAARTTAMQLHQE